MLNDYTLLLIRYYVVVVIVINFLCKIINYYYEINIEYIPHLLK